MSAAEKIPWQELAMTADECGELWGVSGEHFQRVQRAWDNYRRDHA